MLQSANAAASRPPQVRVNTAALVREQQRAGVAASGVNQQCPLGDPRGRIQAPAVVEPDDKEVGTLDPSVAHEQPTAHVLLALRVEVPQVLEPRTQVGGQALDAMLVDLDQVAGGIA